MCQILIIMKYLTPVLRNHYHYEIISIIIKYLLIENNSHWYGILYFIMVFFRITVYVMVEFLGIAFYFILLFNRKIPLCVNQSFV